ncbi:DUF2274 domain-containing protein [Brevundimonas sp.]|uniref:DUF2274 domain-containing protein n=1 Tax=Brevundimonas sp. TaxID=1871086 RepID=UPI001ACE842F|nr:DUF2274 domain-containing protein [Brevundimonas sp.]MBN9466277.1 DUF2274 domain-containing protein [Brevundimonas sp.]
MSQLKLAGLEDDTPVKMTIEFPAEVHRDLVLYADVLSRQGERTFTPAQLILPMLTRFMATDRSFVSERARAQTARKV